MIHVTHNLNGRGGFAAALTHVRLVLGVATGTTPTSTGSA